MNATDPEAEMLAAPLSRGSAPATRRGPLDGWTVAVKDLIDVAGLPTGAGWGTSHLAATDATVVGRLRESGAAVAGKAHMDAWGLGVTGRNSRLGRCPNPWDPGRISGGSSSGSAVAVAMGQATLGVGTDTAGSLRVPAAFCGVTALKPGRGRLPMRGILGVASTLDCVGPIARSAAECAAAYGVMGGRQTTYEPAALGRIGLARGAHWEAIEPGVAGALDQAARALESAGATLIDVRVPRIEEATRLNATVLLFELAHEHRDRWARAGGVERHVTRQVDLGMAIERREYQAALSFRLRWRQQLAETLADVDALLHPTVSSTAPLATERVTVADLTRFTAAWNLAGLPVVAMPIGFAGDDLPVGASLVGRSRSEGRLLALATLFQQLTDWHMRRPAAQVTNNTRGG